MKKLLSVILLISMLACTLSMLTFAGSAVPMLTPPEGNDTYILTDKTEYYYGEPIYVLGASSPNTKGTDWIGISPKGDSTASIYWEYVKDANGKVFEIKTVHKTKSMSQYHDLPVGEYTVYIIPDDLKYGEGFSRALAKVDIKVVENTAKAPKAPTSATYELKNATDGMADGTLTINLPDGHNAEDIYMWWGNDSGKLDGYTMLARFKVTGNTTVKEMTANTIIPNGATKLLIYTYNDIGGISENCYELALPEGAASSENFGELLSEFQIISDTHIKGDANDTYSKNFLSMLNDIVKNSPNSEGIFVVGDNVDRGDKPEYWTYFENLYKSVKNAPPMYLGIGNHEYSGVSFENGLSSFLQHVKLPDGTTPETQNYDCWVNGYHYVFIGSTVAARDAVFTKAQMEWLEDTLNKNRNGQPIFLFLHQPMLDTVSGSSAAEGWSNVTNPTMLKDVLDKFPEVLMFNGHTHWTLDSDNCMYDGKGETASIFNTASVAYLWQSYDIPTGERLDGSQGYYIQIYKDKVLVRGRDFVTGEWVSSAQFVVEYDVEDDPTTDPEISDTLAPEITNTDVPSQTTPEETNSQAKSEKSCGNFTAIGAIIALISVTGMAIVIKKK